MANFDMLAHLINLDGTIMYKKYLNYQEKILNMEVYDDDVWVITFPKSGTTWAQEMVWLLGNNLDYVEAQRNLNDRFPFLEISGVNPILNMPQEPNGYDPPKYIKKSVDYVKELRRPRFIKTHLPWTFLPLQIQNGLRKPKIIYVARNPKDVCVSYYNHVRIIDGYTGTLEEFFELFLNDQMLYCPYWKNVLEYWDKRNDENILFFKFEDMKVNLPTVIMQVAHFLGKRLSKQELEKLNTHLSFDSMKNNVAVNNVKTLNVLKKFNATPFNGNFYRSGKVGSYKSEMSEATVRRFDKWIERNSAGTGLNFSLDCV